MSAQACLSDCLDLLVAVEIAAERPVNADDRSRQIPFKEVFSDRSRH